MLLRIVRREGIEVALQLVVCGEDPFLADDIGEGIERFPEVPLRDVRRQNGHVYLPLLITHVTNGVRLSPRERLGEGL